MNMQLARFLLVIASVSPVLAQNAAPAPLKLVNTFTLSTLKDGNFDHLAIDLKRNRLFVTPEDASEVLVLDAFTGTVVQEIKAIKRPHAILYRADVDRLYITDGRDGSVLVFDGEKYKQVGRVPLMLDADAIGYDVSRKSLYVANGGKDAGEKSSHLSVIDTNSNQKIEDISIDGETLEAMALDIYRPRLYINDTAKNSVVVVNRYTHSKIAEWPIAMCKGNVAMGVDEQRQRLFVGCRSSQIVVLDSNTGKELQQLPIHAGVDDLIYDPGAQRLYASTNGFVDVFSQTDLNHYASLGSIASAEKARTSILVPELNRLFVAAPRSASSPARILVYEPLNQPPPRPAKVDVREQAVAAPLAMKILQEELTLHPTIRRMGLHAIPPGQQAMVIIANVNESRIGVHTSQSDFDGTREGKITGPRIPDGQFFNMKMPMFDAQGKKIGILVMEIPWTDAANEEEAAHQADQIRAEVGKKIPNAEALFATNAH
jgi:hypothetical protein